MVKINEEEIKSLVDTGISENFSSADISKRNTFKIVHCNTQVAMANASSQVRRYILSGLEFNQTNYAKMKYWTMIFSNNNLVLISLLGGPKTALNICGLAAINLQNTLFSKT